MGVGGWVGGFGAWCWCCRLVGGEVGEGGWLGVWVGTRWGGGRWVGGWVGGGVCGGAFVVVSAIVLV